MCVCVSSCTSALSEGFFLQAVVRVGCGTMVFNLFQVSRCLQSADAGASTSSGSSQIPQKKWVRVRVKL